MYYSVRALLSQPATLVLGIGLLVLVVPVSLWLSRRLHRPWWLIALTCGAVGVILVASLGPESLAGRGGFRGGCLRSLSRLGSGIALLRAGENDAWANVLLYLPAGLFLTLLVKKVAAPLIGLVLLSGAIEYAQGPIGRSCTSADWITNGVGAAAGVALGAAILLAVRSRTSGPDRWPRGGDAPSVRRRASQTS